MNLVISKGEEKINVEQMFKKKAKKFNNVGHIIVPITFVDREVIVVLPKVETTKVKTAPVTKKKNGTWKIGKVKK